MIIICVLAVSLSLYIMTQSYLTRRDLYDQSDHAKRLMHNAFQDARSSANFKTEQLALSLQSITKAVTSVENLMLLHGVQTACMMTELNLPDVLRRMRDQQSKILDHMSEMYPDVTPENPLSQVPSFNPDLSYYNPKGPCPTHRR